MRRRKRRLDQVCLLNLLLFLVWNNTYTLYAIGYKTGEFIYDFFLSRFWWILIEIMIKKVTKDTRWIGE